MAILSEINQEQLEVQLQVENTRHANQLAYFSKQSKVEFIRLATQVLLENARSKPVDSREVTASDIATFADSLIAYNNT